MRRTTFTRTAMVTVYLFAGLLSDFTAGDTRGDFIWWEVYLSAPDFEEIRVYTYGQQVPPWIPLFVQTDVDDGLPGRGQDGPPELLTTLGGDLDLSGEAPVVIGALETVEPTLTLATPLSGMRFWSVHDLSKLAFEESTERGVTRLVANDVLRAVMTASTYYNGMLFGVAEKPLTVEILDADDIDGDGNGIPDATELWFGSSSLIVNDRLGISSSASIADEERIVQDRSFFSVSFETADGPVEIMVAVPSLETLRAADPATYNDVIEARLLVSVESNAADLIEVPANVNPLSEFSLSDANGALPPPQNFFIRVMLLVLGSPNLPPQWDVVDTLPGNLRTEIRISGPGVEPLLQSLATVGGYAYDVSTTQNQEDITAVRGNAGWSVVDNVTLLDDLLVGAELDTIEMRSRAASAIFGTNAMPQPVNAGSSGGGGGGGGGCFIATAAYGTPMATKIQSLREVRDGYLVSNAIGAAFVDAYYRISPPVADVIAQSSAMKQGVRIVLAPVVTVSRWFVAAPGLVAMAIVVMAMLGMMTAGRFFHPYGTRIRE